MLNRKKLRCSAGKRRELEYNVAGRRDVRDGVSHEPSTCRSQVVSSGFSWASLVGSSTIKSARICDFAHVLFRYSMSYLLSSIAHLARRPDWLGLCKMARSGMDPITMMEWD